MSDSAIASIVTGIVTVVATVIGFFTLWIKLKYNTERTNEVVKKTEVVESKIDANTALTESRADAAAKSAKIVADTAVKTQATTESIAANIDKKLNGGLEAAIEIAVKPLRDSLAAHSAQDERNMREILSQLEDIRNRIK